MVHLRRGRLSSVLLAAAWALGCQTERAPDLLGVHRLAPARAALSDRITITGEGFPEGREASISFRGDLFRPGAAPRRDVSIVARAVPSGRNALTLTLDAPLERRFVGAGDGAAHTTFHGDLRVSFAGAARSSMVVSGTLRDVVFDVLKARGSDSDPTDRESSAILAALGMTVVPEDSGVGLRVAAVVPDGRAAASGVQAGDVLLDLSSLTVLSASDLVPRSTAHTESLTVLRDGRVLPPLPLDVADVTPLGAADLAWPACGVLAVATVLFVLGSALGRALSFASSGERPLGRPATGASALFLPVTTGRELSAAAALVLLAVFAGLVRLALGRALISSDLDLAWLVLSASAALSVARFADGGSRDGASFDLRGAWKALGGTLATVAPALVATAAAVLSSGRFVVAEMVGEQGGAPLRWAAAQNPGLALLALVLPACALPTADEPVLPDRAQRNERSRALVRLAEWSYLWILCSLTVLLFLGGYRVPGVTSFAQESSRNLCLAGASILVAKVTALGLGVGLARTALGRPSVSDAAAVAAKRVLPTSVAAAFAAAGWAAALEAAPSPGLTELAARTLLVASALFSALFVASRLSLRGRPVVSTLNPWL